MVARAAALVRPDFSLLMVMRLAIAVVTYTRLTRLAPVRPFGRVRPPAAVTS